MLKAAAGKNNFPNPVGSTQIKNYICFMSFTKAYQSFYFYYFFFGKRPGMLLLKIK
jgi:hypothetical protein